MLANSFKKKCALVCLSFLVLPGCQADKTDIEYIESAKKFAVEGDIKSSEISLKNALQINPVNIEARVLLGQQYLSKQLGALAENELQRAVDLGGESASLLGDILQAKYYQFQYNKIIDTPLDEVGLEGENKAKAYVYRGLANLYLNRKWEAETDFKDAANVGGESVLVTLAQSYVFALTLKYADAQKLLDELLVKNPDTTEAYILSSRLLAIAGDFDKANVAINKAIELEPSRLDLYIAAARNYISNKQLDLAEQYLDKVLSAAPKHPLSNLMKANLRLQAKDWKGAKSAAQIVLAQGQVKEALLIAGISEFYLQNWELARNNLSLVKDSLAPDHLAHRLLAFAEAKLGYDQSADSILDSIGAVQANDGKLLAFFGGEFLKKGRKEEAVKIFSAAAEADPEDLNVLSALGVLKLESNDLSGMVDLEKVIENDASSYWARTAIVRNYLKNDRNAEAIEVAQSLIDSAPDKNEGYLLLANVYAELGDNAKATTTLKQALQLGGDNSIVYQRLFQIAVADKDVKTAEMYNSKVLEAEPFNKIALTNRYRLAKQAGDSTKVARDLEALLKVAKDNDELKLLVALFYVDSGDLEKGVTTLKSIDVASPFYTNAQAALGAAFARAKEYKQAVPYFQQWVDQSPKIIKAHQALIAAQLKAGKPEDALASNQLALQKLPENRLLELSEIKILLALNNKEQGLYKAKVFVSKYPESPELDYTLGQFFVQNKDFQQALVHFQALYQQVPTTRSVIDVAKTESILGHKDKAVTLLTEWLIERPKDQVVRLYLAVLDKDNAIEQYRKLLEYNDKHFIALNNLAWALGENGRFQEAITYAESAVSLQPENLQAIDTLGFLLLKAGKSEKAKDTLKKAHEIDQSNATVAYHYALALKENGENAKAEELLKSLLTKDFPEIQAVKGLLNKVN